MDILVRTSQAASICQSLAQTKEWMEVDDANIPGLVSFAETQGATLRRSIEEAR